MTTDYDILRSRADAFWAKVQRGGADECWPWRGFTVRPTSRRLGYGTYRFAKKRVIRAHRAAYFLTFGDLPEGMLVCHACDNPACCNPAHLWLGTCAENNHDRDAKGRTVTPPQPRRPETYHRGQAHHEAKLTNDQVRAIYKDPRKNSEIARAYGMSDSAIGRIKMGRLWRSVTGAKND